MDRFNVISIIAVILGASGMALGAIYVVNFQVIEGPPGPQGLQGTQGVNGIDGQNGIDGLNGTDGRDAPGSIIVGILDPDHGDTVSGDVTIRALIFGSENYSLSILLNGTEIGTSLPMVWNSLTVADGWWNLTVVARDLTTNNITSDEVVGYVNNFGFTYVDVFPYIIIPNNGFTSGSTNVNFGGSAGNIVHGSTSMTSGAFCYYRFVVPDSYITTENIIFHLVWAYSGLNPTIDYFIGFSYDTDGNPDTPFAAGQSSWTGAGQNRRNFEILGVQNINLPGALLTAEVHMEDQTGARYTSCFGVWLEVPIR
ncbi:MAG: hypothetical protein ACFFFG_17265 [Candidatus Thorarchaeota archaeon]